MDFFDWQGAGGIHGGLWMTSATQPGGSAPPEKDAISCHGMTWDWYYTGRLIPSKQQHVPMKPDLETALHLLHSLPSGTLATQSIHIPGYPFPSALPFVLDERHCPIFFLSRLAEHTKNLHADPRAGFLIADTSEKQVLENPRMTLVGDVTPIDAAHAPHELRLRFLRYQPEAEQTMALADFAFYRLEPQKIRYIGGFAQMGWLEKADWENADALPLQEEIALIQDLLGELPPGVRLLGLDRYGIDMERQGKRERQRFPTILRSADQIAATVKRLLASL
jgi:heme iron utilization protein